MNKTIDWRERFRKLWISNTEIVGMKRGNYIIGLDEELELFIQQELDLALKQRTESFKKIALYTVHYKDCILSKWSAGRPTKDGYENRYAGNWYQSSPIDNTPKCECGLDDILKYLKQEEKGE